jgi:hypothetical protein
MHFWDQASDLLAKFLHEPIKKKGQVHFEKYEPEALPGQSATEPLLQLFLPVTRSCDQSPEK